MTTAQLLIFIRGVNDKFDVITELLSVYAVKGRTGEDLYERLSTPSKPHNVSWNKQIGVITVGSQNLRGKTLAF
jgi:hypothetical protein